MSVEGVDYAFPPIPTVSALKAAGKHFACRYGGPGSDSKQLHADELAALTAAGIYVVANAEGAPDGLRGGYSAGKSWAMQAEAHFAALGMPDNRPIYLSVDFDAGSADWAALDAAMVGAGEILGPGRVGVYGSYNVINHFASMKDRLATWYWQTYAWSTISGSVRWHPAAHIQQYRNGVVIGGADCDLNRAMVADYGQWNGDDMEAADVWAVAWGSTNRQTAGDRLKLAADSAKPADVVAAVKPALDAVVALNTKIGAISAVDPAAVAASLAGNPAFVDAIAAKVAQDVKDAIAAVPTATAAELAARLES